MIRPSAHRGLAIFLLALFLAFSTNQDSHAAASAKKKRVRAAKAGCGTCGAAKQKPRSRRRTTRAARPPCHPPGYVDPAIRKNLNGAIRDLRRVGIRPTITSAWRSSRRQGELHRCSRSRRCRLAHPGLYYARPAGSSLHEAGFAVDISGVAAGPRGRKRLTARGRRIVQVMRRHGFSWRYGLADPAHFEIDPRRYGYRSVRQAIYRSQTACNVRLASKTRRPAPGRKSNGRVASAARRKNHRVIAQRNP